MCASSAKPQLGKISVKNCLSPKMALAIYDRLIAEKPGEAAELAAVSVWAQTSSGSE